MKDSNLFLNVWMIAAILLSFISGCVPPYRVQTTAAPSVDMCRYKTYLFMSPEDQTRMKWLSDPQHRQALEDILRETFAAHGLSESKSGGTPDLWIHQRLGSDLNAATQTTDGVAMASDYKLVKWKVELAADKDNRTVWSMQMEAVIGDLEEHKLTRARTGLKQAFADYPSCRTSKSQ